MEIQQLMEDAAQELKNTRYNAALNLYQTIIHNFGDTVWTEEAQIGIIRCYTGRGQYEKALDAAQRFLDSDTKSTQNKKVVLTIKKEIQEASAFEAYRELSRAKNAEVMLANFYISLSLVLAVSILTDMILNP
jgi:outer membrane protein assembly factor BamD (BamD/ComL family)